ncbi:hypothetical protein B0H13DRAFT_2338099 [Mycena leptocephala]|nr:hypothetical protein B0H13DRAFT_2338099 [Mycena leptocephala]
MSSIHIGDLVNGEHAFHSTCLLYNDALFQAILIGVLKSVVRLDETEKILVLGSPKAEILSNVFGGQGTSLVDFLDIDGGRKPRVILTERTWAHNNTVMINTSALTEMKEMVNEAEDDRDVRGPMLGACIRDLMRCAVVMQIEDRSRPEIKGYNVYDRIYRLKANITERIYDNSDLLYF